MKSFQENDIYVIADMATQRDYADVNMSGLDPSSNLVCACDIDTQLCLVCGIGIDFMRRATRHGK
jgi:hypothetical protein